MEHRRKMKQHTVMLLDHCKLEFLVPNNLVDLNESTEDILKNIATADKEFISYAKLLIQTFRTLKLIQEWTVSGITNLTENLETYIDS